METEGSLLNRQVVNLKLLVLKSHFGGAHERLKPPLRPPRPNRTLGGTNLRADMPDVRSSMSATGGCCGLREAFWELVKAGILASGLETGDSRTSGAPPPSVGLGTFLVCCSRYKALDAAELPLR